MKATGVVRRIDDLSRVVIHKGIRRTIGIHEGDLLLTTLTVTPMNRFFDVIIRIAKRIGIDRGWTNVLVWPYIIQAHVLKSNIV